MQSSAPSGYSLTPTSGKDRLPTFFVATYLVSWSCFAAVAAITGRGANPGHARIRGILLFAGIFAPAFVALLLTSVRRGKNGLLTLLRRLLQWHEPVRWYVFAVCYMAAIKLVVALVLRVMTGSWPHFGADPWYVIAVAIIISTPVQAGEEIGWRGYALPNLAKRFGFARASLVLGVLWAGWHLPIFFIQGADKYGQSFPVYLLQVTALSVAATWLYVHTNGSLLPVMLMHSAVNQSVGIVSSLTTGAKNPFAITATPAAWLTVALLWIAAAYFLVRMPGGQPNEILPVTA